MSEFTDDTLGRYLNQQPGMRQALLHDPAQHMQVEALRQTLDMVERALSDEGVSDDVRRRVVNRVVWGEPEGRVDVHAQRDQMHRRMSAGPVRPDEEPQQCGFVHDQWLDGVYRAPRRCIAKAGHTTGSYAYDHGPWESVPEAR